MNIFVDESGNLGTRDRYFVIAFIQCDNSKRIKNFVRRFCARNSLSEIKAARLNLLEKNFLIDRLRDSNDHVISYIVLDKTKITRTKLFEDKNILYNYLFHFLIKRTIQTTREDINVLFDNHTTKVKSINSLSDYIRLKAITDWGYQNTLTIQYIDSRHSNCVQVADLIANSIYRKYTYGNSDLYDRLNIQHSIKFPARTFGV